MIGTRIHESPPGETVKVGSIESARAGRTLNRKNYRLLPGSFATGDCGSELGE